MTRYEVVRRDGRGRHRGSLVVTGHEPWEAVQVGRTRFAGVPPVPSPTTFDVYRVRRLRRPRYVVTFAADSGDGLAGVREPRRPRHDPPGLEAEAPLPTDPD